MNVSSFGTKVSVGYGVDIWVAECGPGLTRFYLPHFGKLSWAYYESELGIVRHSPFGLKETVEKLRQDAKRFKKLGRTNPRCRRRRIRIHGQEFYYTAPTRNPSYQRHVWLASQKVGNEMRLVCGGCVMSMGDLYAYAYNNRYGRGES